MNRTTDVLNALATLDIQIAALFIHDANGRIQRSNEPLPNSPAPRFFFARTLDGNRWRFRDDLPLAVVEHLQALAASEPVMTDIRRPMKNLERIRAVLTTHAPILGESHGPAYRFPDDIPHPSNVVMIDQTNLALLQEMEPDLDRFERNLAVMGPCAVVVEDGTAVSMCFSSRWTAHAAEAGLDTLPPARRRGYAVAVVAAWANAVRESGRMPLYSTSWENLASQAVARRLDLILYAEDLSFS
jgi:hypothetical protein